MDTNGWPAKRRDEVLRLLRRCSAFHIAGDQHLATMVRHGVDDWGDACFSFTGPALNNLWPRRWWPPESARAGAPGDGPVYTGRFRDGFDNRITVLAAANPRNAHARPEILRNRVTGYGMVILDPRSGRIRIECWPRQVPPSVGDGGQYEGWPIEIDGRGGDGRRPVGYLPALRVSGLTDPVVQLLDAQGELVYARRVVGGTATLPVFAPWLAHPPGRRSRPRRVAGADHRRARVGAGGDGGPLSLGLSRPLDLHLTHLSQRGVEPTAGGVPCRPFVYVSAACWC